MRTITRLSIFVTIMALLLSPQKLPAKDIPALYEAKRLKKKEFILRVHEDLFGNLRRAGWSGRRIYKATISLAPSGATISDISGWEGKYFISQNTYIVKNAKHKKKENLLEVKLWATKIVSTGVPGQEVRLYFTDAKNLTSVQFKEMFFSIFFKPNEDIEEYKSQNDNKLIETYIDPHPELYLLPIEKRRAILQIIKLTSGAAKPELERRKEDLLLPMYLSGDTSVYNDLQVSRNFRIASSIQTQLQFFRIAAIATANFPELDGFHFIWLVFHRDFLNETSARFDTIDFYVDVAVLREFSDGELSAFELVKKSLLQVNQIKVTLTTYEPIGAR